MVFLTATTVAAGVVAYSHRYPVQSYLFQYAPPPNDDDYAKNLYIPSYARFGPYIVGLFTGYMLYRLKCKCRIPKVANLTCWFLALALCCVCVYTPYSKGDSHVFTPRESAAFFALHRTGWAVAVCWIVFACSTGHGGWVNEVLSWKAFVPLGRLTYSAYLIHPLVMIVFYMSRNTPTYFSIYEVIYLFLGHLCLSYGIGFVVSLVFESPMMGLEKTIFKRGRK
ncbi:nose resistant to fluoxetine protein 6-like [Ruditapes philippinarum]|uniref:nose resistant to fluoxetine protein 6-like n=1 Tax=Ruditapes philippinarum TaxID=129788 RepID=UPI00295C172A|nr:nose resistant to fluoxetine protein 6-like [Ruditapes philippinarum]